MQSYQIPWASGLFDPDCSVNGGFSCRIDIQESHVLLFGLMAEGFCADLSVYSKPIANKLNGETQSNSTKIRDMKGCPLSKYLFSIIFTVKAIRELKEIKGIQIGKEKVKVFLFTNDMIVFMSDPQNFAKELL